MTETVELSLAEVLIAAQVGIQRQVQNLKLGRRDWNGAEKEDPWRLHINGALGECAVAKYLGRYWSGLGALGHLQAPDVDPCIQVRWRARDTYDLIIQPKDPAEDPVVLVTGTAPALQLHGWLYAVDARRDEWWSDPAGGRPAWFVPKDALRPMTDLRKLLR